jgi:murein DD-endopeptidase MepM/ murein hydrolase activator NlpD
MKRAVIFSIILLLAACYLLPIAAKASLIDDLKAEIAQKEEEIKKLEEQAVAFKKQLQDAQSLKNTLQNQISIVESRIKKLKNDIYITAAKIGNATLKIDALGLDIAEKQNEVDKRKDSIGIMIQNLYEYDQESLIELVLMKNSFSDFLNQVHYLELLQANVHRDMTALQELKRGLEQQKTDMEDQRNQLSVLNNQLYSQKQLVDKEKQDKDNLLIKTKGQEKQYQSLLDDALKKEQEIQQEIYDLEDKLNFAYDPNSLPESRPGVLSWPVDGLLTQAYGITPYSQKLYKQGFHNGIDISSSYGDQIRAARDGKIVALGSCGRYAYGNWIAIEHDNRLTTLYGHMSNYGKFRVGDSVKRGDIIGYEGSTGYSTGTHLHFGVYVSETFRVESRWFGQLPIGAHLDPMKYL